MKVLRSKAVRKYLRLYKIIFGITPPYLVILDGTFITAAMNYKLDIRHRIEGLLQENNIKLFILRSVLNELRSKQESAAAWAAECCEVIADSANAPRIDNWKNTLHSKRYFVATQDRDLRLELNRIPGVPMMYFNQVTLVLENLSRASMNYSNKSEQSKTVLGESEQALVSKVNKMKSSTTTIVVPEGVVLPTTTSTQQPPRQKKKASAPNPLANAKAKSDSAKSLKKKQNKFRR